MSGDLDVEIEIKMTPLQQKAVAYAAAQRYEKYEQKLKQDVMDVAAGVQKDPLIVADVADFQNDPVRFRRDVIELKYSQITAHTDPTMMWDYKAPEVDRITADYTAHLLNTTGTEKVGGDKPTPLPTPPKDIVVAPVIKK